MREVVKTGMATLIMHYEEMLKAGEASTVLVKLQESIRQHWPGIVDSHSVLVSLGQALREKWKRDNLPVTTRAACFPEIQPIVHLLKTTDGKMDDVINKQTSMEDRVRWSEESLAAIQANQRIILRNQAEILNLLQNGKTQCADPSVLSHSLPLLSGTPCAHPFSVVCHVRSANGQPFVCAS